MDTRAESRATLQPRALPRSTLLLGSMVVIAGCASSSYDVAKWHEIVTADIEEVVEELVEKTNGDARAQDAQVFVTVEEFARAMVFFPGEESPEPDPGPILVDVSEVVLPEDAVIREWTDRFALAQELAYRYSDFRILDVTLQFSPPFFAAEVELVLESLRRAAFAGEPAPLPSPPEGHVAWRPRRTLRVAGRGSSSSDGLPVPVTPPGEAFSPPSSLDPLIQTALGSLRHQPYEKSESQIIVELQYDPLEETWELSGYRLGDGFPSPTQLSRYHWSGSKRAEFVFDPVRIRRETPEDLPQ